MTERTTSYHCTEGGSDKVYFLTLRGDDTNGYTVGTKYGARGGRMTEGTKTANPLPLADAEKVFEKEHKARLAKGYRVTDSSAPVIVGDATSKVDSGLRPQLLNPITRAEAEALILDNHWHCELKLDGERTLVRASTLRVEGINRKGQIIPLPIEIVSVIQDLPLTDKDTVFDGERLGSTYAPFDLVEHDGTPLQPMMRCHRVARLLALIGPGPSSLVKLRVARTTTEKRALFDQAIADGEEGVVFKRADAAYTIGRPASGGDALKFKFYETASVRVSAVNARKRSVAMQVIDGSGTWVDVGNVTVPPNQAIPESGQIVEVRYLYWFGTGGSLFQPTLLGRRDLDDADCVITQLKVKGEAKAAAAA